MALSFSQAIANGFEFQHEINFPFDPNTGLVTCDWKVYLYCPQAATIRVADLNSPFNDSYITIGSVHLFGDPLMVLETYNRDTTVTAGRYLIAEGSGETENYKYLSNQGFYTKGFNITMFGPYIGNTLVCKIDGVIYHEDEIEIISKKPFTEPRPEGLASEISCSTTYIGEYANIVIDKWETFFTTTITYEFGSLTGTVIENTSNTAIQWLVPGFFLSEFGPAATKGVCKLTAFTYDGDKLIGSRTFEFNILMDSNASGPLFEPKVEDTNASTIALTGNKNALIKYFSNAKVWAGAVGQSGATIVQETATNGGKTYSTLPATFSKVESPAFDFTATDSRQFTTRTRYMAPWVEYSKLSCNLTATTPNVAGDAILSIEGNYFNGTFGAVANTLVVKYRMRSENESFGNWITLSPKINSSNYSIDIELTGLDYKTLYYAEAYAEDKLISINSNVVSLIGKPVFDWNNESFHITPKVELDEHMVFDADKGIVGITPSGEEVTALIPCDSIGNTVLGYGNYQAESGDTYIYGDNINIIANQDIHFNGRSIGANSILWQGTHLMGDGARINLNKPISEQLNGIVLVFSLYRNNKAEDVSINTAFVSRAQIELLEGAPHFFFLGINAGLSIIGSKYLYIYDDYITGHSGNTLTGNNSGITYNNSNYVLRYVIGV